MRRLSNLSLLAVGNGNWAVNIDIDGITHTYDPFCIVVPPMTLRQAKQLIERIKARGKITPSFWEPLQSIAA